MASKYQDLWLAIGLGILGYYAAFAVHRQLVAIRKVSEVPDVKREPDQPSADDIKLDTLENLIPNVNRDIASAAAKIVAERASQGLTYELLLRGIIGNDLEKRNRSLTTLCYLHERVSRDVLKPHYGTFVAVIDCLCTESMLSEAEKYEEQLRKGGTCYRSQHYYDTLRLLRQIIADTDHGIEFSRQGLKTAIRAGIIARWLANYPWGGINRSHKEKREVFKARLEAAPGDTSTQWIISELSKDYKSFPRHDDAGLHLLEMYGLVDAEFVRARIHPGSFDRNGARIPSRGVPADAASENAHGADVMTTSPHWTEHPRGREESMEEQLLRRRRRREAMVIGGEGRPFALADTRRHTSDAQVDHIDGPETQSEAELTSGEETSGEETSGDETSEEETSGEETSEEETSGEETSGEKTSGEEILENMTEAVEEYHRSPEAQDSP